MSFKICDQGCTFTEEGVNLNLGRFTCQSEGVVIEKCHIVGPSRSLDAEKHKLIIKKFSELTSSEINLLDQMEFDLEYT